MKAHEIPLHRYSISSSITLTGIFTPISMEKIVVQQQLGKFKETDQVCKRMKSSLFSDQVYFPNDEINRKLKYQQYIILLAKKK